MAVPHFSVSIVARGAGRSAVLSAAYRHCAKMEYQREARTIDYSRKQGLLHEEFAIPSNAPDWLQSMIGNRSVSGAADVFWNEVEDFEKRSDAQLAKDMTIALPIELSTEQNIELVRDFVAQHITAKGMVADWVLHDAPGNPHIHLMTTLRPLTEGGFGSKKFAIRGADGEPLRDDRGKIRYELWAGGLDDFNALRDGWFACQNRHMALAGFDSRIDGRSFEKQGIEITPTIHLGVGVKAIDRKARDHDARAALERFALQEERRRENVRRILSRPEIVLDLITRERSVFDERDVAKILHRYIDDAPLFQSLMARILQSPETLRLDHARLDLVTGARVPEKYTTRELIKLEAQMANRAIWLSRRSSHMVREPVLKRVLTYHDRLSAEQKTAIEHVTSNGGITAVIGRAGAGKTTMMKAAREAWEAAGYRVVGGALAGKAAAGLQKEAGIGARTLASWELRWAQGRAQLDDKTIFVLDEAGMVSSRQMALLLDVVVRSGAKLILIGDPEQLQPIEAGAAFRAIADRIGYAELQTIYRQRQQWMRDASLNLARGTLDKALEAYRENGKIIAAELKADAISNLNLDWKLDYDPTKSTLILAHLRRDVRMLNELARSKLIERGVIETGSSFDTADGLRSFAAGDQIVFLKNETSLGVKNGMLARVVEAASGRLVAQISDGGHRRQVLVEQRFYNSVDHGYATTIHKAQGATVDRVKVLASLSMDRHLTYVAMTRHREDLSVYYGRRSFAMAGGLLQILSRRNAKEATLDYAGGNIYAQALSFAEARGLHLVNVARTVARDRLQWTVRQKQRLTDFAARLTVIGARIGLLTHPAKPADPDEAKPMISGITTYSKSIDQAVEEKIASDPSLKKQWEEVLLRFHHVYARPQAALKAVDVDAMLSDQSIAKRTIATIATAPESFGALKGKSGFFANRAARSDRDRALRNVAPLADSIDDYLRQRGETARRQHATEVASRKQAARDIPALSAAARQIVESIRDAIDRKDFAVALEHASADTSVKIELDGFAKAVCERFGERTFLSLAASDATGEAFMRVTAGMNAKQKREVAQAWSKMRTVQQLSAHERTVAASNQAEALRQAKTEGLGIR
ncbi:Ti-type conjugative transfer relaxase TraA [Pseudorhizobium tarimense]|uniref:Ti-type conjugative transfer relaxase TraA n=1 Tax=Pseudorhizobium tarimense TaxID=1079109 RepID=A0ABV2HCX4_9HYPH|nr:Ti-type conjugative transfer relaxase TraA [Pseudorhizobium tarimense]MCJ8521174.1 Ti-type conjugative transfer relaxase TraA [Pseudorhizobium tarimense]